MNDLLDDRLRTMMRTATADAPEAPTVDDLRAITVVRDEPRSRTLRPVAAAAAVVALVGAGALVWWTTGDDGTNPADSPETTEAGATPGAYLDAYYLPTDLPEGWQIVDARRDPGGAVEFAGDTVVFARRDGTERAVLSLTPVDETAPATTEAAIDVATGDTQPLPPAVSDEAVWDEQLEWLSWSPGGQQIIVKTSSRTEAAARDLAADVIGTFPTTGVNVDVRSDSDWVKVKDYTNDPRGRVSTGSNSLSLVTADGRNEWITVRRTEGLSPADWLDPVPGSTEIYETATVPGDDLITISRLVGDHVIEVATRNVSADDLAAVRQVLAGMRPVTEQEWLTAVPDLDVTIGGLPTVRTFELLEHTVTVHFDGTIGGVCVEGPDATSACIHLAGMEANGHITGSFPATGFRLDDDTWVAVSSIPEGAEMCTDPQELQGAQAATADNDGQTLVLLVAPAEFTEVFTCPLTGSTDDTLYMASPPLP